MSTGISHPMGGMGLRLKPWRLPMFTRGQYWAGRCEKLSPAWQHSLGRRAPLGLALGEWQPLLRGQPLRLQPSHQLLTAMLQREEERPLPETGAGDAGWWCGAWQAWESPLATPL